MPYPKMLFFINDEEKSFSLIDPELGIGLPSRYEYLPELGIYKLHIGCEGNVENWRVIENNDITAVVSDAQGDVISLFYLWMMPICSYLDGPRSEKRRALADLIPNAAGMLLLSVIVVFSSLKGLIFCRRQRGRRR